MKIKLSGIGVMGIVCLVLSPTGIVIIMNALTMESTESKIIATIIGILWIVSFMVLGLIGLGLNKNETLTPDEKLAVYVEYYQLQKVGEVDLEITNMVRGGEKVQKIKVLSSTYPHEFYNDEMKTIIFGGGVYGMRHGKYFHTWHKTTGTICLYVQKEIPIEA